MSLTKKQMQKQKSNTDRPFAYAHTHLVAVSVLIPVGLFSQLQIRAAETQCVGPLVLQPQARNTSLDQLIHQF